MTVSKSGKLIKPLSVAEAAYIAGIIDGEGCITISRKKCDDGTRGGYQYRPIVSVSNTKVALLEWLQDRTGLGAIKSYAPSHTADRNNARASQWTLWSNQAKQLLEACMPYLVIKKEQAQILLAFIHAKRDGVGIRGLSAEEWQYQIDCHTAITALNVKGKKANLGVVPV